MQADPTFGARGAQTRNFKIEEITANGFALGTDNFGIHRQIPMGLLPAKSSPPLPGEIWVISNNLGIWAFTAIANNPGIVPVTIGTGSGSPTTGTWTAGQLYFSNQLFLCTVSGSPGTWVAA